MQPALLALSLVVLLATARPPAAPPDAASSVLAEAHAPYFEDAAVPRVVASVHARVLAAAAGPVLELSVVAGGDGVEPVPGFAGVPGTNLKTATELDRLLAAGTLRLVTRDAGAELVGTLVGVARRPLPERRVAVDGAMHDAATRAAWPAAVTFRSAPLSSPETWSYLEADGVPRLAVGVQLHGGAGGTAHVVVESLGAAAGRSR